MGMLILKYILAFVLLISTIFIPQQIYSSEGLNLPDNKINPESFLYPIKRLSENILLKFNFSSDSIFKFHRNLTKVRLAELKHVAEGKLLGRIETSSQRFAYQVGTLTDYIVSQKFDKEKETLLQSFEQYKPVLAKLRDLYSANSSYWLLLQQDIDTLDLNAAKLK